MYRKRRGRERERVSRARERKPRVAVARRDVEGFFKTCLELDIFIVTFTRRRARVKRALGESIDFRSQQPRHLARWRFDGSRRRPRCSAIEIKDPDVARAREGRGTARTFCFNVRSLVACDTAAFVSISTSLAWWLAARRRESASATTMMKVNRIRFRTPR